MNENIELYFRELINKYGSKVSLTDSDSDNMKLEQIPVALNSLYKLTSKAKLPFGEIFDIDKALVQSERTPFSKTWGRIQDMGTVVVSYREEKKSTIKRE
jgi:hypothetical protein